MMMQNRRGMRVRVVVGVLALSAMSAVLGGCWTPGGTRGWSPDSYTYESFSYAPQTVTVKDVRTGETLWTYDIPVGMQLSFKFHPGARKDIDPNFPDLMKWDVWEVGTRFGQPRNELAVPGARDRLVDVTVRKSPELPETMRVNSGATPAPAAAKAEEKGKPATAEPLVPLNPSEPRKTEPMVEPVKPVEPAVPSEPMVEPVPGSDPK
jgi:hypothetical protein